jgi:ceramide synthetase
MATLFRTNVIFFFYRIERVREKIVYYYALETGYYVFSTFAVFFEPKMKDRGQLFIHHLFTSFLLISSWFGRMTRFGVPIMLLHDIADPPMELAKLCLYSGYEMVTSPAADGFILTFLGC